MGFGGISIWQLLIILVIVLLLFGTKKLRNIGGDLGSGIKSFRKAVKEDPGKTSEETAASESEAAPEQIETSAESGDSTGTVEQEEKASTR